MMYLQIICKDSVYIRIPFFMIVLYDYYADGCVEYVSQSFFMEF